MSSAGDCTRDTLFDGRLHCVQHRDGYRFSIDAVLLAHFVTLKPGDHVLDLCAGCGIISLIIAYRWPHVRLTAFELQPQLAALIRRNRRLNDLDGRLRIIEGNCRQLHELVEPGAFAWVLCNPPYRKPASGRQNPGLEQTVARHEVAIDLNGVIRAISWALKTRGRAALIYPASRAGALLAALTANGLEPKRLRIVYSYPGSVGKLVLVEAVKGGGEELAVLPPCYIYARPGGEYSEETARCYRP